MTKERASFLANAVPVLLVLAAAAVVRGENVFTDDFKGDGDQARFVIEAEHYSSRSRPTSEGWWEVDGKSHRFIDGPGEGKDAPTADTLRAGEDAAGDDTADKQPESAAKKEVRFDVSSRVELLGRRRPTRGDYKARGNYMLIAGVTSCSFAPTDVAYEGAWMDYRVAVETPGEYRLYTRWLALDGNHDSFYAWIIGPDGTLLQGAGPDYFTFHQYAGRWQWDSRGIENTRYASLAGKSGVPIWIIKKPGEYTIRVARREINTAVDALVLQTADLPHPEASELTESRIVDKPAENKEILAVRVRLLAALAQRRKALQSIDEALAREKRIYESLGSLLASGEHADLSQWNITEARQRVGRMIQSEERSREALAKAAEQLQGALKALGWTPPPPPEQVAFWNFDEGEGPAAGDSAGDNHGTIHGAKWTDGKSGKALSFDGVDDYVEVGDDLSLRFMRSSSFAISCWVMPASEGEGGIILSKMRAAGGGADLRSGTSSVSSGLSPTRETILRTGGRCVGTGRQVGVFGYYMAWNSAASKFGFAADSSWKGTASTGTRHNSAPAGRWYHVAAVYSDSELRIYLNGELEGRRTFDLATGSTTPDKNLVIGAFSYDSTISRFFAGKIDEVCIYNGALSATDVNALYQRGSRR